jgi:PAS domain S-box-containing protein
MTAHGKDGDSVRMHRLREKAEALLSQADGDGYHAPNRDASTLIHEFQVFQAELEVQNEELRRIQFQLGESRDRFARLFDLAPVGYLSLDQDGVIEEANLPASRLIGLDRHVLIGEKFARFVLPESQDEFYLHRGLVLASESLQTCELKMRRSEKSSFIAHLETSTGTIRLGEAPRFLVALTDVTSTRRTEDALAENQAQLAAIINSAWDAIITVDTDQRVVLVNEAAERMFGYTRSELMGQSLEKLIPSSSREKHAHFMRKFSETGVASRGMGEPGRVFGQRANGTEFPIEASISRIQTPHKKLLTVILRDITQRLKAEDELRAKEADLADSFANSPIGKLWVNSDGQIVRVNHALHIVVGHDDGDMLGRMFAELFSDESEVDQLTRRIEAGETVRDHRTTFRHRDGSIRYVLIDGNGRWDGDQLAHARWFVRDITSRVALQSELAEASEREQQRIGSELHDGLGQQLHALSLLAKLLLKDLEKTSSPHIDAALRLSKHIDEAGVLARNLAHGLQPVNPEPEGLMIAMRELASRTREIYRINCTFRCKQRILVTNPIVAGHLYRIAQEAVNNAMKHGHPTRLTLMLSKVGEKTVLGVKDNGKGFRVPAKRAKGMGLHIMRHRSDVIDGTLVIQRHPKGGTEVVCTVPERFTKSESPPPPPKRRRNRTARARHGPI